MKYCKDCGGLGDEKCARCGGHDLHEVPDFLVMVEFSSLIESQFTPFDRHAMEAMAIANEEES